MTTRSWIRRVFDHKPRTIPKAPARRRPLVEELASRIVLSAPASTTIALATPTNTERERAILLRGLRSRVRF